MRPSGKLPWGWMKQACVGYVAFLCIGDEERTRRWWWRTRRSRPRGRGRIPIAHRLACGWRMDDGKVKGTALSFPPLQQQAMNVQCMEEKVDLSFPSTSFPRLFSMRLFSHDPFHLHHAWRWHGSHLPLVWHGGGARNHARRDHGYDPSRHATSMGGIPPRSTVLPFHPTEEDELTSKKTRLGCIPYQPKNDHERVWRIDATLVRNNHVFASSW